MYQWGRIVSVTNPHVRLLIGPPRVGWSVKMYQIKAGKLHLHAPIGAVVFPVYCFSRIVKEGIFPLTREPLFSDQRTLVQWPGNPCSATREPLFSDQGTLVQWPGNPCSVTREPLLSDQGTLVQWPENLVKWPENYIYTNNTCISISMQGTIVDRWEFIKEKR